MIDNLASGFWSHYPLLSWVHNNVKYGYQAIEQPFFVMNIEQNVTASRASTNSREGGPVDLLSVLETLVQTATSATSLIKGIYPLWV